MEELVPRLRSLAFLAKSAGMGLNIDAEEADRLTLSLDVIEAVLVRKSSQRLGRVRRRRASLRAPRALCDRPPECACDPSWIAASWCVSSRGRIGTRK